MSQNLRDFIGNDVIGALLPIGNIHAVQITKYQWVAYINKVINVCIHQLELARKRLMTEGRITKHDATTASQLIEDGEICVYLLDNINWEGVIPSHISSFALHSMQTIAERADDTLEVNKYW